MEEKWFYANDGTSVGPVSMMAIVERINEANNEPVMVWTDGMAQWAEASTLAEFSSAFPALESQHAPDDLHSAGAIETAESGKATLAQRARDEVIEYLTISAYLAVCFGALIFYKAAILRGEGIDFEPYGLALVKALISAKFILILQSLKLGERGKQSDSPLNRILTKALLFTFFLLGLTIIEELLVGYFHGLAGRTVVSEIAGGTVPQAIATALLMFMIMVPYFAYREVAPSLAAMNAGAVDGDHEVSSTN